MSSKVRNITKQRTQNIAPRIHAMVGVLMEFSMPAQLMNYAKMDVDCLLVVVDVRAPAWAPLDAAACGTSASIGAQALAFPSVLTALETFICFFGASSRKNQLAVFAFNDEHGGYILPDKDSPQLDKSATSVGAPASDLLRPAAIKQALSSALMHLRYGDRLTDHETNSTTQAVPDERWNRRHASLAACVTLALCHHHKLKRVHPRLRSRLLIVQAGRDSPAQYVPLINCAFTAQRHHVAIDSLLITPAGPSAPSGATGLSGAASSAAGTSALTRSGAHSVFLEQAAYLTGGQHLHPTPSQAEALLALMIHVLLPPVSERSKLLLPPSATVDLRAHCFCHKAHRTVAWVCTVCLSIFCAYAPVCATCGTKAPTAAGSGPAVVPAAAVGVTKPSTS